MHGGHRIRWPARNRPRWTTAVSGHIPSGIMAIDGDEPVSSDLANADNWQTAPFNRWAYWHVKDILPTQVIACAPGRVRVSQGNWRADLSPRHSEIMALLVLHPDGLTSEQLLDRLQLPSRKAVTVRAEISRLRRVLGPILLGNPYRLQGVVHADPDEMSAVVEGATPASGANGH